MSFLSTAVQQVLEQGSFCAVASTTPRGPHCTPLVFAYSGGRVWLTTSRGSVKARAWKIDPGVAGLVRSGELSVTFTGTVRRLRRRSTGARGARRWRARRPSPGPAPRSARRTRSSSPGTRSMPARCRSHGCRRVASSSASTSSGPRCSARTACRKGAVGGAARRSRTRRSAPSKGASDPLAALPDDVRERARRAEGDAALALGGDRGPVVVPGALARRRRLALRGAARGDARARRRRTRDAPVALTVDRASEWRARDMVGAMVQGTGAIYVLDGLGSGAKTARVARDVDRPRGRRARAHRADPPGVVEGMVQREPRGRMTTVEFSVEVDAPPERVWKVTSDPREPAALGQAHRVGARAGGRAGARRPLRGDDAVHGVADHGRRRGPGVGAAVACGDPPVGVARGDGHHVDRLVAVRTERAATRGDVPVPGAVRRDRRAEHPGGGRDAAGVEARRAGAEATTSSPERRIVAYHRRR